MIKQFKANYKTLIPAIVASGVVLYEALTGHQVSAHNQSVLTNDSIAVSGFIITVAGILYNHFHKKDVSK
jgi:hypothetical protein